MFTIITIIAITAITYGLFYIRSKKVDAEVGATKKDLNYLLPYVKKRVVDMLQEVEFTAKTANDYAASKRTRDRYSKALRECVDGNTHARDIVISIIRTIIQEVLQSYEECLDAVDFNHLNSLDRMTKFEILLNYLSKKSVDSYNGVLGKNAMPYLTLKYPEIIELREHIVENGHKILKREFSGEMLDYIFEQELKDYKVSYVDAIEIIAILIYQRYKGFGAVDTLYMQNIDGLEIGTSGTLRAEIDNNYDADYTMTNSVWIQCRSPFVHYSFIDLYNEGEMRRIASQFVTFGNVAPPTKEEPTRINETWDGSRVVCTRPPAAECWTLYVRKFSLDRLDLDFLLNKGEKTKNWLFIKEFLVILAKASLNVGVTGGQNTGKTTMLKAMFGWMFDRNIRILETSFETHLRELYPWMNSNTMKTTPTRSASQLQDEMKKMDSNTSCIAEVADDISATRMIQFGLVGSNNTLFSSHHKTNADLVQALANSCVASGEYKDFQSAVDAVLAVIQINVHMARINGERVIEHISLITPIPRQAPYEEPSSPRSTADAIHKQTQLQHEHYTRVTDRPRFEERRLAYYDEIAGTYVPDKWLTPELFERLLETTPEMHDKQKILSFVKRYYPNAIEEE